MIGARLAWHWLLAAEPSQLVGLAMLAGGGLFLWWFAVNTNRLMDDL